VELAKKILGPFQSRSAKGEYAGIALTDDDIRQGSYKTYLGGGAESWEPRGAFQVHFLRAVGLTKESRLLDVGCGPGRAGKHLISFLDSGNYWGIDYNASFIAAARAMAKASDLEQKNPTFAVIENFNVAPLSILVDYVLAFSVLNHCDDQQRGDFFRRIPASVKAGGKVYISHAQWFNLGYITGNGLTKTNEYGADQFDIVAFGWGPGETIFPIVELTRLA
jgi:SAM-dependent methyltransferase